MRARERALSPALIAAALAQGLCGEEQAQAVYSSGGVPAAAARRQGQPQTEARCGGAVYCRASFPALRPPPLFASRLLSSGGAAWGNARAQATERRDEAVVMVKNEELIQTSVCAREYVQLVKGTGGAMGGALCTWLRVGRLGAFGLDHLTATNARRMFMRLAEKDPDAISADERAQLASSLGLLSYVCDPHGMHELMQHNLQLALREMGMRAGGDEALALLQEDGLVVLAVTTWGAAPVQSGGRAAERKYVDIIVHLSPATDDVWGSGDVTLHVMTPAKKGVGGVVERGGKGGLLARAKAAAVSAGGNKEYSDSFKVDAAGQILEGDLGTLVVRQGSVLVAPAGPIGDLAYTQAIAVALEVGGLTREERAVSVHDVDKWDEVLLVGAPMLCSGVKSVDLRSGDSWQRSGPESALAVDVRARMRALVHGGTA